MDGRWDREGELKGGGGGSYLFLNVLSCHLALYVHTNICSGGVLVSVH